MIDYETEYPVTYRTASRLIEEARKRAPTFLFLNTIFEESLKQLTDNEDDHAVIREAAREYLRKEDQS
jgi:hypothetical protein